MRSASPLRKGEDSCYGSLCSPHHHIIQVLHLKKGQSFPLPRQVKLFGIFLKHRIIVTISEAKCCIFLPTRKMSSKGLSYLKQNLAVTLSCLH